MPAAVTLNAARPEKATGFVPDELVDAVAEAKAADPLAPVTLVCPSGYAAVFARRALAVESPNEPTEGIVGLGAIGIEALTKAVAAPVLAARGMRPAGRAVTTEAARTEALTRGGWLGRFAGNARALVALERTLAELGACPAGALEMVASASSQAAELVALLEAVKLRLHARGFADDEELIAMALETASRGGGATTDLGVVLAWDLDGCSSAQSQILDRLHARRVPVTPPSTRERGFDEVVSFPDPEEEVRGAARSILGAAEDGVPLWRQAVLCPTGSGYPRLLRQVLGEIGIPANGPLIRPLGDSATAVALTGLLELARGDWSRDEVLAWLSNGPVACATSPSRLPVTRWDLISAAAGVIRGPDQWKQRLELHAERYPDSAEETTELWRFVEELIERARPPARTWKEHCSWALGILDRYVDPSGAARRGEEEAAGRQLRHLVESLGELDEVSGTVDTGTFAAALEVEIGRSSLEPDPSFGGGFGDGVFVAPFAAARGLTFEQVVVCGLADSIVPGPTRRNPILDEEVRAADTSGTLLTAAEARAQLREDLRSAASAGIRKRLATFPRCDPRSGRAQVPSRWLEELTEPTRHSWKEVPSFAATVSGRSPALSVRELRLRALDRWSSWGGDPARSPVALSDPRLTTGLEAVTARHGNGFSRFDGRLGEGRISALDVASPVSATRFETYAHCPRRYLFERALGVSPRVLPEELWKIAPVDRGSLVHAILETYVGERIAGAPRSQERLLEVAAEHLDAAEAGGLVGKRLLWRVERASIMRDMRRFHREEQEDLVPLAAELGFGIDDPESSPAVVVELEDGRSVHVRGSIDRVDLSPSGRLVVTDYKTGKQAALSELLRDPVARGKLLQLPLYGLAALGRFGSTGPVHTRYWLLSGERSAPCYNLVLSDAVLSRFGTVVGRIASGIEAGCFPAVPGPPIYDGRFEGCNHCDFDSACPPHRDRQWNAKLHDPALAPVVQLLQDEGDASCSAAVSRGFVRIEHDTGATGHTTGVGETPLVDTGRAAGADGR